MKKMKKTILSLILITILGMTIVPSVSLAQDIMNGCTPRHTIDFGDETYDEGVFIGEPLSRSSVQ